MIKKSNRIEIARFFNLFSCKALTFFVAFTASAAHAQPFAYISSQASDTVTVVDTVSDTIVKEIPFDALGYAVAIDPAGSAFYVATGGSCGSCISVVNTSTNTVADTIAVDHFPSGMVVSPDGLKLYSAANEDSITKATVTIIDTSTSSIETVIELPASDLGNRVNPRMMAVSPGGETLYVNDFTNQRVLLIDTVSRTVTGEIPVDTCPLGMDIAPDGSTVYVASFCALAVNVIDTASNTVIETIVNAGDRAAWLAVSPDGTTVYVTNITNDHSVTVIDTASNSVVRTIPVEKDPDGLSITPDGRKLYVTNRSSDSVSVIDTGSNTVVDTITGIVGPNPGGRFIAPGVPAHTLTITTGPEGVPNPVASGSEVEVSVSATDTEGHELAFAWEADCSGWAADDGSFNDPRLRDPIWRAPENATSSRQVCQFIVTVDDDNGLVKQAGYEQQVLEIPHQLTITDGPGGDPNPVETRGVVDLYVVASDNRGHAVGYDWSSNCQGDSFDDNTAQNPRWTAPANNSGVVLECVVSVTVDDGVGGLSETEFFVQLVSSGPTGPGILEVTPTGNTQFQGGVGGPFFFPHAGGLILLPPNRDYTVENTGGQPITVTAQRSPLNEDWISLTNEGPGCSQGFVCNFVLNPQDRRTINAAVNENANALALGDHSVDIQFTNGTNHNGDTSRTLMLSVNPADDIPPVVTPPPDVTIPDEGLLTDVTGKLGQATAIDNLDGEIEAFPYFGGLPNPGPFSVGVVDIEWRATDSSGNTGNAWQKLTILDRTPPELIIPADKTRVVTTRRQLPVFVNPGNATATDLHDPNPVTITNDAPVDSTFPLGETIVRWTAKDWEGNQRVRLQKITVVLQPGDLAAMELIQVSQDPVNSVLLVEGKNTILRVYYQSFNGRTNSFPAPKLTAARNGQPLSPAALSPRKYTFSVASPNVLNLRTNASSPGNLVSLVDEYLLPEDWTTGTVTFLLSFDDFVDVDCSGAVAPVMADCSITKTFALSEIMELKMVTVEFTPSDSSTGPFATTTQDLINERNHIMAQFPVSDIHSTVGHMVINGILEVGWDYFTIDYDGRDLFDEILDNLDDMRDSDSCYETFGDCQRIYYAVATRNNGSDSTTIFNREEGGTVLGLGQSPGRASTGLVGSYGTSGQEIGHNFGMSHTLWKDTGTIFFDGIGPCDAPIDDSDEPYFPYINSVDGQRRATLGPLSPDEKVVIGWDSDTDKMIPVLDASDTMSYCSEKHWPSKFTYGRFWSKVLSIFGLGASPSKASDRLMAANEPLSAGAAISFVRGFIYHDPEEIVAFKPTGLLVDPAVTPPPEPPGDFLLRRFDGNGLLVDETSFHPSHVDYRMTNDATPIPGAEHFSVPFEYNPDVREVVLLHEGEVIGSINASEHAPTIRLLKPNGSGLLSGDTVTVAWSAQDRDGDNLTFDVQFTPDGGTNWQTIAVKYNGTSLPVNLNSLPATDSGMFRVYARDGFHVAYDTSDVTFSKANSPPEVHITLPYADEVFGSDQTVILRADSGDVEDVHFSDTNLSWVSDRDGLLGNGHELLIAASALSPGEHLITLTGTDSAGATGRDKVRIMVFEGEPPLLVIRRISVSPDEIWPTNHQMVPVTVKVRTRPVRLEEQPECAITSIVSNEELNGSGDGNTVGDSVITGPLTAEIRAERSGTGSDRVYSINVECTAEEDGERHTATGVGTVTVPHNH